jgi:hypothetical protein
MEGFEKICPNCKKNKCYGDFYKDKSKVDGKSSWCKECLIKKNGPTYKLKMRQNSLKKNYNITLEDYDRMLDEQQGLCAMCGRPETTSNQYSIKRLSVDHNHKTGKVRALLCSTCNVKLGVVEDEDFMKKVQKYLKGYDHS